VAHLDSVSNDLHFVTVESNEDVVIFNEQLDDRLGAYIILDVLPKYGIKCDILLTTGEESGWSTAQGFISPRDYNWMFQFDRSGTDVVTYDFTCDELTKRIEAIGVSQNYGLFSDICDLEHLGCKGMNWGTGYYDNHTQKSNAVVSHIEQMILKFVMFYYTSADIKMDHVERKPMPRHAYPSASEYAYEGGVSNHTFQQSWGTNKFDDPMDNETFWDVYVESYDYYTNVKGYDGQEAHTLAMEDAHTYYENIETMVSCPGCGYDWPEKEMANITETGLCDYCYSSWLNMREIPEGKVIPLHRMTDAEWHDMEGESNVTE